MTERWIPKTEAELEEAVKTGLLDESHWADFKRELAPGAKANRDLAIDIAAFSIEGGCIYIGVDQPEGATASLTPVGLAGLPERVDEIARSIPDEPVRVRTILIFSSAGEGIGYLVVVVPPSEAAPHMVDGRYRARGDRTNLILNDAQVRRLVAAARVRQLEARQLLDDLVASDPAPEHELRQRAHLFLLAHPVTGRPELLLEHLPPNIEKDWIWENIVRGTPSHRMSQPWSPDFEWIDQSTREAVGWGFWSGWRPGDGPPRDSSAERNMIHLAVREDGSVRLFCGGGSDVVQGGRRVLSMPLVHGLTKRVVAAAQVIAAKCSYFGSWDFGLALARLGGVVSHSRALDSSHEAPPYSEPDYKATTRATFEELDGDLDPIVSRLTARLCRALDDKEPIPDFLNS